MSKNLRSKIYCKSKEIISLLIFIFSGNIFPYSAQAANTSIIYVDNHGRMRYTDTKEEARFYGTNYTLPFAHGFRALNELGIDHKKAIDRDVYHMSRMGMNAFRLHLWDAELADSIGNLLDNEHTDLLDYLISSMENRNITIILTAQTNFGNGYPEKNIDTGAFTYDFDKCRIHEEEAAIKAQERYIAQLVRHVNPYTGKSYSADPCIIAMEINNEPCHNGSKQQVKKYIDTMASAMKKSGWEKPILYNVSHNMPVVESYYNAEIDGTTYQWYPIGLVSGHRRSGNFLPFVDNYAIPFSGVKGFEKKAKIVYEFDPADILDSYMFPAIARTFAREGFQWATQFAYDPIDIAGFNTEYQTHYLNLVYTPQKALGMKIAMKVMERTPEGADYGKYPADTVFGNFTVSYKRNLAMLNSGKEYYHTNTTDIAPLCPDSLTEIAGFGSSPLVDYQGRGAYLIDRLPSGVWRLEVLPDILYNGDPFVKPSLTRRVAHAINRSHYMTLHLPGLCGNFFYQAINNENPFGGTAENLTISVIPGVYLLGSDSLSVNEIDKESLFGNIFLNEYVAPLSSTTPLHINHTPKPYLRAGDNLTITAEAFGEEIPDSLVIYPADASFWRDDNRLYTMRPVAPYIYEATIPAEEIKGKHSFSYRIAVATDSESKTFPGGIAGLPLDWDAPEGAFYTTNILRENAPIVLLSADNGTDDLEISTIPDVWGRCHIEQVKKSPIDINTLRITARPGNDRVKTVITKHIKDLTAAIPADETPELVIRTGKVANNSSIITSFINSDGITFSKEVTLKEDSLLKISLKDMSITPTLLCPAPYPSFLEREFTPENYTRPLIAREIEKLQIVINGEPSEEEISAEIVGAWLQ